MMRALIFLLLLSMYVAQAIQLPQNPSPMQDDTREHRRPREVQAPGQRVRIDPLTLLLLPDRKATHLVIHFHGPPWFPELVVRKKYPGAAVVTLLGDGGSDIYRNLFLESGKFAAFIAEIEKLSRLKFKHVLLSAFSAGYGGVREILRDPANRERIDAVLLADSMHATYGEEKQDLGPFIDFARDAIGGKKRFLITHSEVYPGTYSSSTETASYILKQLGLRRTPILQWGAIGMQQLSRAGKGGFQVLGFAGNSAPDHIDHYYALDDFFDRLQPAVKVPPVPARKKR
jgi:hypothetical protein